MKSTEKDVLLICKEHYDHEKYGCLEDALDAYYRLHYDVPEKVMPKLTHKFMCKLWFRNCVAEFATPDNSGGLWAVLFDDRACLAEDDSGDYWAEMFNRIVNWLHFLQVKDGDVWLVDLSDYEGNVF